MADFVDFFAISRSIFWVYSVFFVVYLVVVAYENIAHFSVARLTVNQTILRILLSIFFGVLFFAYFYYALERLYPGSFVGEFGTRWTEKIFSFAYFSFLTITTTSYGDIYPISIPARIGVMLEIVYMLLTVGFIGANFTGISNHFRRGNLFTKGGAFNE